MKVELSIEQGRGEPVLVLRDLKWGLDLVRIKIDRGTLAVVERTLKDIKDGYHSPTYLEANGVADRDATF